MSYRSIGRAVMVKVGRLGMNLVLHSLQSSRLLVLCYHSVVPDDVPHRVSNAVRETSFAAQLEILAREFHPISAAELRDWFGGHGSLPPNPVLVTFDDGYRNNLTHAAPILLRYRIPAVIFVTSGYVGTKRILWPEELLQLVLAWKSSMLPLPYGQCDVPSDQRLRERLAVQVTEHAKILPSDQAMAYLQSLRAANESSSCQVENPLAFLTWDEVRELARLGFEIGSHTIEHPILSRLSPECLAGELQESKFAIERETGRPCRFFAYPNGRAEDLTPDVVDAVGQAGYDFGFTTNPRLCTAYDMPLALGRFVVPANVATDVFRARISWLR